jgi:hypothetical protein
VALGSTDGRTIRIDGLSDRQTFAIYEFDQRIPFLPSQFVTSRILLLVRGVRAAQQTRYNIVEMFIFALIGILCGLLGALFNHMRGLLSRWATITPENHLREMSNNTYKPTIDIHRPYRFRDMA